MPRYKSIKQAYIMGGRKAAIHHFFGKLIGIDDLYERLDTAYYFLNHYCDIKQFPEASGELRKIQEGDVILLQIVDKICKKYEIKYWLDAGTLLGAVRHNGFIPWDDDVDICVLRDDYDRIKSILQKELNKYGLSVTESTQYPGGQVGVSYKHKQTGLWIDIFPVECCKIDASNEAVSNKIKAQWRAYRSKYNGKRLNTSKDQLLKMERKMIDGLCEESEAKSLIYCPMLGLKPRVWSYDDIFPLKEERFENHSFYVPNHVPEYLWQFYGKNYMSFPQTGLEHHGDENGILSTWASKSGINMDEVCDMLNKVCDQLE